MIKLIASDLDGTLLQNGALAPSPHAIDLISQLLDRGVYFSAASGRPYSSLRALFAPIKDRIFYIAENGSLVLDQGRVLARGSIETDLALRIIRELKKNDNLEIMVSTEQCCFVETENPQFYDRVVNVMHIQTQAIDNLLDIPYPIIKIAIGDANGDPKFIEKYLRHLKNLFFPEIKAVTSGNTWIDFIAPNANKGTALTALMKHLSVKPEECMAFGDQYNDVEMLQTAGVSYAMANAAPGISYYSKYITRSVEEVLEDLLLTMNYTVSDAEG